jgi:ATP-dependent Lhr-like helicase
VLQSVRARELRVQAVETASASPFARSLLFDYIAEFMYEGDAPLAERRAQALALDRERLRELLGQEELRELLDPTALQELELELQGLGQRRARSIDQVHDLLRRLGDLTTDEVAARSSVSDTRPWLAELEQQRRAVEVRVAGEARWIAIEDVARYRDGLGIQPPRGMPEVFLAETTAGLEQVLARWARTHAPFTAREPAGRWGVPAGRVADALRRLEDAGTLLRGEFRPGGSDREWCDPDVLRALRRRSLARLRREVEPVPAAALARFLPAWHGLGTEVGTLDRLLEVISQLEGLFLPWSIYERDVLAARVRGYVPRLLDELCASGEVVWLGRGALGNDDGRVALYRRERLALLAPAAAEDPLTESIHQQIREHLAQRGASFFREIFDAVDPPTDQKLLAALWDLVWSGEVTNDTPMPLRMRLLRRSRTRRLLGVSRGGPPDAAGRWSLVRPLPAPTTERLHGLALTLLERHGVVTREAVLAEGIAGGFAAVYPVLRAMEEAGKIRRGYFVEGLGAAQFALPGAVDRLRAEREALTGGPMGAQRPARTATDERSTGAFVRRTAGGEAPSARTLAAADPANPYGATLPWPHRAGAAARAPQRVAGAYVVLVDGEPVLYLERGTGSRALVTLPAFERDEISAAAAAELSRFVEQLPRRELTIERVDGAAVLASPARVVLEQAGFQREYLGLTRRVAVPRVERRTA